MKCKNCSRCCQDIALPYGEANEDEKRWIEYHGIEVLKNKFGSFIKISLPCSKLKDNRCSIYKERPEICRWYDCEKNKEFLT
jgi:Fe-S-cluster containining protein